MSDPSGTATVIPSLRYADAKAAITFLCKAFGFEETLVVPGEGDSIAHAQLTFNGGMVMLGSSGAHDNEYDRITRPPEELGGKVSGGIYVVVEDVDGHRDRAVAAGAKILMPLVDQDYGGRGYSCLDPEGQVWSFGSYDPMADGS